MSVNRSRTLFGVSCLVCGTITTRGPDDPRLCDAHTPEDL